MSINEPGKATDTSLAQQLEKKIPKKSAELTRTARRIAKLRRWFGVGLISAIGATATHQAVSNYVDIVPSAPVENQKKDIVDKIKDFGKDQVRNSDTVKAMNEKIKNITSWSAAIAAFALLSLLLSAGANLVLDDSTENARNKKIRDSEAEKKQFDKSIVETIRALENKISTLTKEPTDPEKDELRVEIAKFEQTVAGLTESARQNKRGLVASLRSISKMKMRIGIGDATEPASTGDVATEELEARSEAEAADPSILKK